MIKLGKWMSDNKALSFMLLVQLAAVVYVVIYMVFKNVS